MRLLLPARSSVAPLLSVVFVLLVFKVGPALVVDQFEVSIAAL